MKFIKATQIFEDGRTVQRLFNVDYIVSITPLDDHLRPNRKTLLTLYFDNYREGVVVVESFAQFEALIADNELHLGQYKT